LRALSPVAIGGPATLRQLGICGAISDSGDPTAQPHPSQQKVSRVCFLFHRIAKTGERRAVFGIVGSIQGSLNSTRSMPTKGGFFRCCIGFRNPVMISRTHEYIFLESFFLMSCDICLLCQVCIAKSSCSLTFEPALHINSVLRVSRMSGRGQDLV